MYFESVGNMSSKGAAWLACRTRDPVVAGSIPNQAVVIALGKQFTLTFPSPPTCKMGTQL